MFNGGYWQITKPGGLTEAQVNALIAAYGVSPGFPASAIVSGTLDNARVNWGAPSALGSVTPANVTGLAIVGSSLSIAPDTDVDTVLGRARFSTLSSDFATLGHYDRANTTDYAVRQSAAGVTDINGTAVHLGLGNARKATLSAASWYVYPITALTSTNNNSLVVEHNTSGTPVQGFSVAIAMLLKSSTTTATLAARLRSYWNVATHASRAAYGALSAYDTAERDAIGWGANGSAPLLGFYDKATAPIAQAVLATGAGATVDNVITALQNLGLVKQS